VLQKTDHSVKGSLEDAPNYYIYPVAIKQISGLTYPVSVPWITGISEINNLLFLREHTISHRSQQ